MMRYVAIKGIQAGKEYFIIMVKLKEIESLFLKTDESVQPENRAQRKLNEKRIPAIKRYILENKDSYVFSALAASVDGIVSFRSISNDIQEVGVLEIADNAKFLINDGQHRRTAIIEALKECHELGNETIPVVLFKDRGLKRSQQMFTDLNKHAVKTSNSLSELYDSNDIFAEATRRLLEKNRFIGKYTDREKDNLSMNSAMIFTFSTFYKANQRLVGKTKFQNIETESLLLYWDYVVDNIQQWRALEDGTLPKSKLRADFLVCQSVVIEALGQVGNSFYENNGLGMEILAGLKTIDWSRDCKLWYGRCVKENQKMVKSNEAVCLTAIVIKKELGLRLTEEEQKKEKKFERR